MQRFFISIVLSLAILGSFSLAQVPPGRIEVEFWYANKGLLGDALVALVNKFNEAQDRYWVTAVYKGGYATTMADAIAAFRAGQAPHIVQVYEVGTATMMAAAQLGAVYPLYQLFADTGVAFDFDQYIPAIRGYYSLLDGRMVALPFNASTAVMWYNKDAFRKAGLDPDNPPKTWAELRDAAKKIAASGAAEIPFTVSWLPWTMFEQLGALHNVPFATKENGFGGLDTELALLDHPLYLRHLENLVAMQNEGTFVYVGRDTTPDGTFPAGKAAILIASSALRGRIQQEANFEWGETYLPYYPDIVEQPYNSILGGAALWVMRRPDATKEHYKAVAEFLAFLSQPENVAWYHTYTGYLPTTVPGYELAKSQGYYDKNPGADIPVLQLMRGPTTENTRGIRLGDYGAIRDVIYDEVEATLQGKQSAMDAIKNIVARGNEILRNFEATYR